MGRGKAKLAMVLGWVVGLRGLGAAGEIGADLAAWLGAAAADEQVGIVVRLTEQAVRTLPEPAEDVPRAERRRAVLARLRETHEGGQAALAAWLDGAVRRGRARAVRAFWIVNAVTLEATPEVIAELAGRADVEAVELQHTASILPIEEVQAADASLPAVNGVNRIRAPQVWNLGDKGSGAVIGFVDTGVSASHPDVKGRLRTRGWRDEVGHRSTPYDDNGHGTHVVGTAVGRNVVAPNYIGVAWQAKYVMCKAFNAAGAASDAALLGCMQWLADPDRDPSTDDIPDVVNNSWSTDSAGCDRTFHLAVRAWRALDIVPVFAAGNSAVAVSPANYPESVAVGAVDRSNEVTYFSGRGPSGCDGRLYPDVVAPGTQVRSAWPGGTRRNLAGTSMAAPHVAGTVALLRSQKPTMTAAAIVNVLRATAVELGPRGPDNFYGHGLVDAFRAFNCLQNGTASGCVAACP